MIYKLYAATITDRRTPNHPEIFAVLVRAHTCDLTLFLVLASASVSIFRGGRQQYLQQYCWSSKRMTCSFKWNWFFKIKYRIVRTVLKIKKNTVHLGKSFVRHKDVHWVLLKILHSNDSLLTEALQSSQRVFPLLIQATVVVRPEHFVCCSFTYDYSFHVSNDFFV